MLKARLVLQDCRRAIEKHNNSLQNEDFRISWYSIVSMLRSIGHVLAKIDINISPKHKLVIEEKWRELNSQKPQPEIFWSFVEDERNRFLKEYEHGVDRQFKANRPVKIEGQKVYLHLDIGNGQGAQFISPEFTTVSQISSGFYKGQNEKDVALLAVKFWEDYLDDIEMKVKGTSL